MIAVLFPFLCVHNLGEMEKIVSLVYAFDKEYTCVSISVSWGQGDGEGIVGGVYVVPCTIYLHKMLI